MELEAETTFCTFELTTPGRCNLDDFSSMLVDAGADVVAPTSWAS